MIMSSDFELVDVAGEHMAVPVGEKAVSFKGVIALSEAAFFLLQNMNVQQTKESLLKLLCSEYDIDVATARTDLEALLPKLLDLGLVNE